MNIGCNKIFYSGWAYNFCSFVMIKENVHVTETGIYEKQSHGNNNGGNAEY